MRLSGEDSQRGTFTHRHAVWIDQKTDKRYFPLSHIEKGQAKCAIYNSTLSEYGALGFEFGYSLVYPSALVMWEAQFGDFVNGAQIIIDQYISSSEKKWRRYSGLVMLLPHGYEGGGPEHSSARLERFLQNAAEKNIQVVNPTTPCQYFHLLRRQVLRKIRLPLIVMSPKVLLRHPKCLSSMKDLSTGSFQEIIDENNDKKAKRVLLCSGKIYYELLDQKEKLQSDTAIVRIEQLYPLHQEMLSSILQSYSHMQELYWVQEEPKNMGAYSSIAPKIEQILPKNCKFVYVGRKPAAATATGSHKRHISEQKKILEMAFS